MSQETEKITKEEILKELKMTDLSDEALEKIAGGYTNKSCYEWCIGTGKTAHYCEHMCEELI